MERIAFALALALAGLAPAAVPDTVVLKSGKKLDGVVVSRQDDQVVVVNPWNSRWKEMEFEIPDKDRIPRDKVEQVIVSDPPLVEYRRAASKPGLKPADHDALAKRCGELGLKEEQAREAQLALGPTAAETAEHEYVAAKTPEERAAKLAELKKLGSTKSLAYLERARRSAQFPKGRRDKVRLTLRSESAAGATYCIYVPKSYDPLVPSGLVVGLHGGGPGGFDKTIVTGSGEEAMNFYTDVAEETGLIVVCPTALAPGWSAAKNEPLIDAVVDEMLALYDVDENRIYLTGHSMGGGGTWYWGPKRADLWAAFAPCAGWGGSDPKGVPVYIYHAADDAIVGVGDDRAIARILLGDKKKPDFVYTEYEHAGHDFPDWVRHDVFRFLASRWKDRGRKRAIGPESSFLRKPSRDEVAAFGDPAASAAANGEGGASASPEARLNELVARLEKGGGGGAEAATELGKLKDAVAVKAVARVLHSKKANGDARVLAAKALGEIALPECVKPLAAEAEDDDFRVVDAVAESLGKTKCKDAIEPLGKVAKRMGALWEASIRGREMIFTEYQIRCASFGLLCDSYRLLGDAAAALPVLQSEVVARVFAPKVPYEVPADDRFDEVPGAARLALTKRLRACVESLGDPNGRVLLEVIKASWPKEAPLVRECDEGIAKLTKPAGG